VVGVAAGIGGLALVSVLGCGMSIEGRWKNVAESVPVGGKGDWPGWLVSLVLILMEWLKSILERSKGDE